MFCRIGRVSCRCEAERRSMIRSRPCSLQKSHRMQLSRGRPPGPQAAVCAATPKLLSTRPLDVALDAGSSTSAAMRFHISTGHEQGSYSAQVCPTILLRTGMPDVWSGVLRRYFLCKALVLASLTPVLSRETTSCSCVHYTFAVSCGPQPLFLACDHPSHRTLRMRWQRRCR